MKVPSLALLFLCSVDVKGFQQPRVRSVSSTTRLSAGVSAGDYLSQLGTASAGGVTFPPQAFSAPPAPSANGHQQPNGGAPPPESFFHASRSYFDIDKLTPKGPRAGADVGQPHDSTRPLATVGAISSGSWWCAKGGWPSPNLRATTEVFYVFSGHGCLTDTDGTEHYFGPGDTVILPKGWSGRWDVLEDMHKVWFVHDHPNFEHATDSTIHAVIENYNHLLEPNLEEHAMLRQLYKVGPTTVGCSSRQTGSFHVTCSSTESFHLLEGLCFLTSETDGTARRCAAGDTVILPKGWTGIWDIVEPVKKLWVQIDE